MKHLASRILIVGMVLFMAPITVMAQANPGDIITADLTLTANLDASA